MAELSAKELLDTLGIDGVESLDKFKEIFNKSFVSRKTVTEDDETKGKIVGKLTGSLTSLIKQEFGLEKSEIEDKKIEDIILLASSKTKSSLKELQSSLEKSTDEKVAEWQGKAEKYKKDYSEYKSQADQLQRALQEKEKSFESEKKSWTINHKYGETEKEIFGMFSSDVIKDELKIEGFKSMISRKYKFDLDDSGEVAVYDSDGKRVANPNKIGSFMTPKEVLIKESTERGMVKLNPGQVPIPARSTPNPAINPGEKNNTLELHPNLKRFGVK